MYFKPLFIKPNKFYIYIFHTILKEKKKKIAKTAFFRGSKVNWSKKIF